MKHNSEPPIKIYQTDKTIVKSSFDTWSSDLLDMNYLVPKITEVVDIL